MHTVDGDATPSPKTQGSHILLPIYSIYIYIYIGRRKIVGGGAGLPPQRRTRTDRQARSYVYTREARITAAHPRVAARVDSAAHARAPVGWPRRSSARFEATTEGDTLQSDAGLRPSRLLGGRGWRVRSVAELVGANAGRCVFPSPAEGNGELPWDIVIRARPVSHGALVKQRDCR